MNNTVTFSGTTVNVLNRPLYGDDSENLQVNDVSAYTIFDNAVVAIAVTISLYYVSRVIFSPRQIRSAC